MFRNKKNIESDKVYESSEELKKEKRKAISHIVMVVIAAIVIIIAFCIAWFVSNTRVQSTGSAVSADAKSVELKTYGGAGIHDDLLKKLMSQENPQDENWYTKVLQAVGLETSAKKYSVNWLLSDQSSIGNYSANKSDWEEYWRNPDDKDERRNYAIEPGSSGNLKFSIVPKKSGTITCNMQLSLIPYMYANDTFSMPNEYTQNFVRGHILLFLVQEENEQKKIIQWLPDGEFQVTLKNAEKDKEYPYTIYWCWPQNFAEIAMNSGDPYLNERKLILSDYSNGTDIRKMITGTDSQQSMPSMVNKPERYFYSNLTQAPLAKGQKDLSSIGKIGETLSSAMDENVKNSFIDLSSYYNQADQYIGSHANCLRVKLEMDPVFEKSK